MASRTPTLDAIADLAGAPPARAGRALAELRRSLEQAERKLRGADRGAGQMLRQSRIDELRILALEFELGSGAERAAIARLIHARLGELAADVTPLASHEDAAQPA